MTSSTPTWCDLEDVTTVTGVTAEQGDLLRAQFAMDALCGRSIDVQGSLRARDLHFLKLATAYQCAWMMGQPDLYSRTEVRQSTGDGVSVSLPDGALVLAPMARRALRRVSWRRSRSVSVAGLAGQGAGREQWRPM